MHLLTSFEWDTCVGLLHGQNISMVVKDIIVSQRNTNHHHSLVTFLKLESIDLANKKSPLAQMNLQGGERKKLFADDFLD